MKPAKELLTRLTSFFQSKDRNSKEHNTSTVTSSRAMERNLKESTPHTQVEINAENTGHYGFQNFGEKQHQSKCQCVTLTLSFLLSIIAVTVCGALAVYVRTSSSELCLPCAVLETEDFNMALLDGLRRNQVGGTEQCCARSAKETQVFQQLIEKRLKVTEDTGLTNPSADPGSSARRTPRRITPPGDLAQLILDVDKNRNTSKDDEQKIVQWRKNSKKSEGRIIYPVVAEKFKFENGSFRILVPGVYEVYSHVHLKIEKKGKRLDQSQIKFKHTIAKKYGHKHEEELLFDSKTVALTSHDNEVTSSLRGHFKFQVDNEVYVKVNPAKSMIGDYSNFFGIKFIYKLYD